MKGREYSEEDYVGLVHKDVVTESGDKIGKVEDVVINKSTKEGVLKVSQGILKTNMVIPLSEVLRVDADNVIVSDQYYKSDKSESEEGVQLR
ncbi:MAG: PRC-barrel domain-containing protein [Halobacteriota archaeon]